MNAPPDSQAGAPSPLPLTGERTVPGVAEENYWFQRHVAAYRFAASRCQGLRVLDAGAGEGYGTAMLAETAAEAVGVELVDDVVAHARHAYPRLKFIQADLCEMPLPHASFDAVVSLQVIEHLPDIGRYLAEIERVLRPGGEFICATPNRLTFTPDSDTPVNPFHVIEFSPDELSDLLGRRFRVKAVLGLHHARRVRAVERLARRPFTDLVLDRPPEQWPRWLRRAVRAVRPDDFRLRADALDDSLDLVAIVARHR
ncbi:MAG TPA: class I SAM-dependent methyltransferase [Egibacteraceae bacterium]|nr:class I SAM-dependent methyltransferase [Egibacteraceae bacterium]